MSRHHPIWVYASDEEPTEATYDSQAASSHGDPSIHDIATSDDEDGIAPEPEQPARRVVSDDTTAASPAPLPRPAPVHLAETSRGPLRRTPRMCIRDFPTGLLAPRDKAPMVDQDVQMDEQSQLRPRPAHLAWMPSVLRNWRSLEGFPSTYETGESSHTPSPTSLTGEPLELTVATLVAVVRKLFGFHYGTRSYIREFHSDASRLDGDVGAIYGRLHATETSRVVDRVHLDAHRVRLEYLERRERVLGVMVGIGVLVSVVRLVMMLYFRYLY